MAQQALILYYSQFGNTAKLASHIHQLTGADILRVRVADGTFPDDMEATDDRYQEQRQTNRLPQLVTKLPRFSYYDDILVGGPVWDGQLSSPVMALLNQLKGYSGKVAPFSTGWSDTGKYQQDFITHAKTLDVLPGYHVLTHGKPTYSPASLMSWLRKI